MYRLKVYILSRKKKQLVYSFQKSNSRQSCLYFYYERIMNSTIFHLH